MHGYEGRLFVTIDRKVINPYRAYRHISRASIFDCEVSTRDILKKNQLATNLLNVEATCFFPPTNERLLSASGVQRNTNNIQLLSKCFVLYLISDLHGVLYFQFQTNIHCYNWCDFAVDWDIFVTKFDVDFILSRELDLT